MELIPDTYFPVFFSSFTIGDKAKDMASNVGVPTEQRGGGMFTKAWIANLLIICAIWTIKLFMNRVNKGSTQ